MLLWLANESSLALSEVCGRRLSWPDDILRDCEDVRVLGTWVVHHCIRVVVVGVDGARGSSHHFALAVLNSLLDLHLLHGNHLQFSLPLFFLLRFYLLLPLQLHLHLLSLDLFLLLELYSKQLLLSLQLQLLLPKVLVQGFDLLIPPLSLHGFCSRKFVLLSLLPQLVVFFRELNSVYIDSVHFEALEGGKNLIYVVDNCKKIQISRKIDGEVVISEGFRLQNVYQIVDNAQLGSWDRDSIFLRHEHCKILIRPHFSFALRIDTNNVGARIEEAKLLKQYLESGADISQNQECLGLAESPNFLE